MSRGARAAGPFGWMLILGFAGTAFLLCCTLSIVAAQEKEAQNRQDNALLQFGLRPGMTSSDVTNALGEPAKRSPSVANDGTEIQTWYYANGLIVQFAKGVLKAAAILQ